MSSSVWFLIISVGFLLCQSPGSEGVFKCMLFVCIAGVCPKLLLV